MSLANVSPLVPTPPQLPVAWYVDPTIFQYEQKFLFANSPSYIGHTLMAPNAGDFYAIPWMNEAKALVHHNNEINLISNICRHRQAIMLNGKGNTKNIVCPLHRWTYDLKGELIGAPHFEQNPCLHLSKTQLRNWQGLLFDSQRDISKELNQIGCKHDFDFTGYMLDTVDIVDYNFNWKTFIEVYLEDYHVGPFHPGLHQFVNCDELDWDFGDHYSVQTVGFKPEPGKHASQIYQHWQNEVRRYSKTTPKYGAIWMVYYPMLMVEWYPNVLVISNIIPTDANHCRNVVEFYYPEDIALFERNYIDAQQAAYNETAIEDKEICQRMHDGRKALFIQGTNECGPYQHPMETGMEHFHRWYRKQMEHHLANFSQR